MSEELFPSSGGLWKISISFHLHELIGTAEFRVEEVQASTLAEQGIGEWGMGETNTRPPPPDNGILDDL